MKSTAVAFMLIAFAALLVVPTIVSAQKFTVDESKNYGLATGQDGDATAVGIIEQILGFVLGFLAVLSILIIVIAGLLYITSGGNEDRIATAKTWLIYAIVGLVVSLLAFVIVRAVATGLNAGV